MDCLLHSSSPSIHGRCRTGVRAELDSGKLRAAIKERGVRPMLHGPLRQRHFGGAIGLAAGRVDAAVPPDFYRAGPAFNNDAIGERPGIGNLASTAAARTAKTAMSAFEFDSRRFASKLPKTDPATLWPQAVF